MTDNNQEMFNKIKVNLNDFFSLRENDIFFHVNQGIEHFFHIKINFNKIILLFMYYICKYSKFTNEW